jgi:hypothetical protein
MSRSVRLSFFNPAAGRIHGDGWGFKGIAPPQDLIFVSWLSNVKNEPSDLKKSCYR